MPKSKSKKRKLNHVGHSYSNHQNNGELTHEEIWDDSALLRSWNDAVAEYEFYHSIHAKGEDLDEVLRRYETETETGVEVEARPATAIEVSDIAGEEGEIAEEGEIEDDDVSESAQVGIDVETESAGQLEHEAHTTSQNNIGDAANTALKGNTSNQTLSVLTTQANGTSKASLSLPKLGPSAGAASISPAIDTTGSSNGSHDQTLENIKMAYYWAGYYSGLYDGQRQSQPQTKPPSHT